MEMNQEIQDEFICRIRYLNNFKFSQISSESLVYDEINNITDSFRWLRNNCILLNECNKFELLKLGLIETCLWFCEHYFMNKPLSRSILLQLLANLSINNKIIKENIFKCFQNILRHFILSSSDVKLFNCSVMLIYNLCLSNENFKFDILKDINIVMKIITHWIEYETDFSKIFLDSIFSNSKEFLIVYKHFSECSKNPLMDLLSIWLDNYKDDMSLEIIIAIKDNFFINCTAEEITDGVMNILAKASNIDKFSSEIKKNSLLFNKLIDLLVYVHERGKNNGHSVNEFSRLNNLNVLFNNSDLQTQNRFWFKSDIIQMIANMCYNNLEYQNLMRTKNIIPILLDCCSFDAKNPLIREWSLLAFRNTLEGNLDNQNFVANINLIESFDPEL